MGLPHPNKQLPFGKTVKWVFGVVTQVFLLLGLLGMSFWCLHIWNAIVCGYIAMFFSRPIKDFPLQARIANMVLCLIGTWFVPSLLWVLLISGIVNAAVGYDLVVRILSLLPVNRYEPLTAGLIKETFLAPPKDGRFSAGKRPDI